jgi:hypothetical protein
LAESLAFARFWLTVSLVDESTSPIREASTPMTNARKSERVTINKEFESFDQFVEEYVTNISRSGAFVKTSTPLPVGTEVDLRFTVVIGGIETIEGIGQVVRVETDPAGMGVVFKELSGYSAQLIDKLLTAKNG